MKLLFANRNYSSWSLRAWLVLRHFSVPFDEDMVLLNGEGWKETLRRKSPTGQVPVLVDGPAVVPETIAIIEYLNDRYPGRPALVAADREIAREIRLWDRFFDLYMHAPMQKIVADRLQPHDARDETGVQEARATLDTAYAMLDRRMSGRVFVAGEAFSMADCAAMPPLFYLAAIHPYHRAFPALGAYFERLASRPAAARVIREAQPWFRYFPFHETLDPRFLGAAAD